MSIDQVGNLHDRAGRFDNRARSEVAAAVLDEPVRTEYPDGTFGWHLNGQLHRVDGPAVEDSDGHYRAWWLNGGRHRVHGPAVEGRDGYRAWWLNGERHRVDGPAVEGPDGTLEWWLDGVEYPDRDSWRAALPVEAILALDDDLNPIETLTPTVPPTLRA